MIGNDVFSFSAAGKIALVRLSGQGIGKMSLLLAILVPDGVILGSDSRQVTRLSGSSPRILTDNATKIFALGDRMLVGFLNHSVFYSDPLKPPVTPRALLRSVQKELPEHYSTTEAINLFYKRLEHDLNSHSTLTSNQGANVGFYIAGYEADSLHGFVYRGEVPGTIKLERTSEDPGLLWSGERTFVDRIILGYDQELRPLLSNVAASPQSQSANPCSQHQVNLMFRTMDLNDAVDLAISLISTTVVLARLSDGFAGKSGHFPLCGGMPQIGVISPFLSETNNSAVQIFSIEKCGFRRRKSAYL